MENRDDVDGDLMRLAKSLGFSGSTELYKYDEHLKTIILIAPDPAAGSEMSFSQHFFLPLNQAFGKIQQAILFGDDDVEKFARGQTHQGPGFEPYKRVKLLFSTASTT